MNEILEHPSPPRSDWPEEFSVVYLISRQKTGHYVALVKEFDVAGQGASSEAAMKDAEEMMWDYLGGIFQDGGTFAEAQRPMPRAEILRFQTRRFIDKVKTKVTVAGAATPPARAISRSSEDVRNFLPGLAARC